MRRSGTVALDARAIVRRMDESGAKRFSVARKAGVSERTLSRWMNGSVRRAAAANAKALASALGVPLGRLIAKDPSAPGPVDRARAARAIATGELLRIAGPAGSWDLAEHVVKGVLDPALDARTRARLRLQLATTQWRQGRLDEAEANAGTARDALERARDRAGAAAALVTLGTIASLQGRKSRARRLLARAVRSAASFEDRASWAAAVNNLGMETRDAGDPVRATALLGLAVTTFTRLGLAYNRAIALSARGQVRCECGQFRLAAADFEAAEQAARDAAWSGGIKTLPILALDARDLAGERIPLPPRLLRADLCAGDLDGDAAACESLARLLRRHGRAGAALAFIQAAVRDLARTEPVGMALLLVELSRILRNLGRAAESRRAHRRAMDAYRRLCLPRRMTRWPAAEHGRLLVTPRARSRPPHSLAPRNRT